MPDDRWFLGSDLGLASDGDLAVESGDFAVLEAEICLRANLLDRLMASPGDLVLHPDFGAGITDLVGQPMGESDLQDLKTSVRHALLDDPRVAEVLELGILTGAELQRWLFGREFLKIEAPSEIRSPSPTEWALTQRAIAVIATVRAVNGQVVGNIVFPFGLKELP